MERIVLEVEPRVAQAWNRLSVERQKAIKEKVSVRLGKEVLQGSNEEYLSYLKDLRETMASRGLTQEILESILNEK